MVTTAPAWGIDAGFQYLNDTNISIINASLEGLKHSAGYTPTQPGYAYLLGMLFIVFLVYFVIYTRTQKAYASLAGTSLILFIYIYFNLLDLIYIVSVFSLMVAAAGIEFAYNWWNND